MTSPSRFQVVAVITISSFFASCAAHRHAAATLPGDSSLAARLDEALQRGRTGPAHYCARVVDLKSGQELYAVDADAPCMPASNGKIAVGAATLDFFGPSATFKTYLALDGNDLWIIGTGDPGIGDNTIAKKYGGTTMTVLDRWIDALEARGITQIKGNLYYYDRAFDEQWLCPSWSKDYITEWFAAPISGLNFNNNCVDISVMPAGQGQPVGYKPTPPAQGVKVDNRCITGAGDPPDVKRAPGANIFTITGATTKPVDIKGEAVTDPGGFFADALRTRMARRGIAIAGATKRADKPLGEALVPPKGKIIAVNETKMADAIGRINKQSQNNFAEGFCKMLGRAYRQKQGRDEPGSWEAGAEATKAFLDRNGIDSSKIVIVDGSGLSRQNRVTAHMISDVFVTMWKHPYHETFFNSLGTSGIDGTIDKRLKDLKGRVHAKTGFIGGVRALSGYVKNDAGDWLVFSIIYNGFNGSAKPFEAMQDNAVRVLAAWPRQIELPATRPTTNVASR